MALLLTTLQVVWLLPDEAELLSSPTASSRSRVQTNFQKEANPRWAARPYSVSPRSLADPRTVWSSAEQLDSMKVCARPFSWPIVYVVMTNEIAHLKTGNVSGAEKSYGNFVKLCLWQHAKPQTNIGIRMPLDICALFCRHNLMLCSCSSSSIKCKAKQFPSAHE